MSEQAESPKVKSLKAYIAKSYDGESDVIVFSHRNDMAARREAASEMPSGDVTDVESLRRAPEFDDLAGKRITARDYIERGCWFECSGCSRQVDDAMENASYADDVTESDDGTLVDGNGAQLEPSYHPLWPSSVWCSADCRENEIVSNFLRKVELCEEHEHLTARVLRCYPDATDIRVSRRDWDKAGSAYAEFVLPGFPPYCKAEMRIDSATAVWVSKPAHPAFYAYETGLLNAQDRDPGDEHCAPRSRE